MITRLKLSTIEQGLPKYRSMLAGNSAYIPTSFESIATVTGNGSATELTFSSIPSTYKHLQIRGVANDAQGSNIAIRFNGDTGTNYAFHFLRGSGTTVLASGNNTQNLMNYVGRAVDVTNVYGASIIDIQDYTSTTNNKTVRSFWGYDTSLVYLSSGLWINTSAITSVTLRSVSGFAFNTSTSFALYGIKGA